MKGQYAARIQKRLGVLKAGTAKLKARAGAARRKLAGKLKKSAGKGEGGQTSD